MNIILSAKKIIPSVSPGNIIGDSLGHNLTINKSGKYNRLSTKTKIEGLGPCVGLIMWAGKNKFEAHSAPELEAIGNVQNKINKIIKTLREKLKNSFDEVHAFITGGIEYNPNNPVSWQSMDLITEMYEAMQKESIPNVILAGQRSDGTKTRLNTFAFNDNISVFGKPIDSILESDKTLEENIKKQFDFVELNENIPITVSK